MPAPRSSPPPSPPLPGRSTRACQRIGFAHEYRQLTPDELTAVLARRLPAAADPADGGVAHATAVATIVRITAGHFRLVDRLLTQIERVQAVNNLDKLTPEIVETARQALLLGH